MLHGLYNIKFWYVNVQHDKILNCVELILMNCPVYVDTLNLVSKGVTVIVIC